MINLNSILATYPEWGQKVPPLSPFGGRKAPSNIINKGSREKSLARKVARQRKKQKLSLLYFLKRGLTDG